MALQDMQSVYVYMFMWYGVNIEMKPWKYTSKA